MVPQVTCSSTQQCWLRAWERARAEQLIPYRNTDGSWSVKEYIVTVTGPGWSDPSCSCPSGQVGRPLVCKHLAVVAKAIAAHVRPIRGTEKAMAVIAAPAAIVTLSVPSPLDAVFA